MPTRRVIQPLQISRPHHFDDRLWPANVVLIALAVIGGAAIVALGGFDNPRPWANGWVRLIALGATCGLLFWAVNSIHPRRSQRIKLCLALSLVVHTLLAVAMYRGRLEFVTERRPPLPMAEVESPALEQRTPEFVVEPATSEEKTAIERPVATGAPRVQTDERTPERTTPRQLEAAQLAQVTPDAQPQPRPHPVRLRRPQETVALKSRELGQRSRRPAADATVATTAPSEPATATSITSSSQPTTSSQAALLESNASAPDRAETAPMALPDVVDSRPDRVVPRQRIEERLPALARDTTPSRERQRVEVAPTIPREATTQQLAERTTLRSERVLQSQPSDLARADPQQARSLLSMVAPDSPTAPTGEEARTAPRRASPADRPALRPHDRPRQAPRQAVEVAQLAAQPVDAPSIALSQPASQPVTEPQPSPLALARAESGMAAGGDAPNVGEDLSADARRTAPRPSAASSRRASTQRDEGPALAPSTVARVAKALARADVPAATLPATSLPQANVAGARQPSQLNVSSSAALERRDAAVPRGDITAAVGENQLDTGAPQVVPHTAGGEGAGGGQPQLAQSSERTRRRRPSPSAAMPSQLAASQLADTVGGFAATGGGAPPASDVATSSRPAGLPRAASSTTPAEASPAGAPLTASVGRLSASTEPRRRSAEAMTGLESGGGPPQVRRNRAPAPAAPIASSIPSLASTATPDAPTADPASSSASPDESSTRSLARSRASRPSADASSALAGEVAVVIDAPLAVGGLGWQSAPRAGLADRRASPRADLAHLAPARMRRKRVGGLPTISGTAREPTAAFSQRGRRQEDLQSGGDGKPSARTEAAIELGLEFLARVQLTGGRWAFDFQSAGEPAVDDEAVNIRADAAATGLALLAFLGAGYDHFDGKHQSVVEQGLQYLVRNQKPSGEIFPDEGQAASQVTRFYSHGIAALALSEAFGMTGDPALKQPAQRALDYIIDTQHPERGGWRYQPGVQADLSVSGWQLMALRSGELAGLDVPRDTYRRLGELVERCREEGGNRARFRYNPWASATNARVRHGRQPSTVMTAVGLLMQLYLGSNRDDRPMQLGANHLLSNLPQMGTSPRVAPTGTLGNPLRDTYYWYYATQVMFHMGGEHWQTWNDHLHPLLVESQTPSGPLAGSWHPRAPVPDKWADYGGRLYVTTMNLLSLEVYYRHLPLYEMTAQ